jgi:hypothetical protein
VKGKRLPKKIRQSMRKKELEGVYWGIEISFRIVLFTKREEIAGSQGFPTRHCDGAPGFLAIEFGIVSFLFCCRPGNLPIGSICQLSL